jgi:hypothetical protein
VFPCSRVCIPLLLFRISNNILCPKWLEEVANHNWRCKHVDFSNQSREGSTLWDCWSPSCQWEQH